jgi:predicted anti-sigma-YlaC factor YlaD
MKPCAKNQKVLSLLATNDLERRPAEELRAHVETCPGCRHYLEEMSNVAGKLTASSSAAPKIAASATFHRRLARRIEAEGQPGIRAAVWAFVRSGALNWRVAMPVAGVVVLGVFVVIIALGLQRERQTVPRAVGSIASAVKPSKDPAPTFGSYRMLADRSLDALNQELTKEAEAGSPGPPTYTALSLARAITAD